MQSFRFSELAERDISAIYFHSIQEWGVKRADKYVADLYRTCKSLTIFPDRGRRVKRLGKELMRLECQRHVIFYRKREEEILVVRILHDRMLPQTSQFID